MKVEKLNEIYYGGLPNDPDIDTYSKALNAIYVEEQKLLNDYNITEEQVDNHHIKYTGNVNGYNFIYIEYRGNFNKQASKLFIDNKEVDIYNSRDPENRYFCYVNRCSIGHIIDILNSDLNNIVFKNTSREVEEELAEDCDIEETIEKPKKGLKFTDLNKNTNPQGLPPERAKKPEFANLNKEANSQGIPPERSKRKISYEMTEDLQKFVIKYKSVKEPLNYIKLISPGKDKLTYHNDATTFDSVEEAKNYITKICDNLDDCSPKDFAIENFFHMSGEILDSYNTNNTSREINESVNDTISSEKGFYVGDICYALDNNIYHEVWGGHDYADGTYEANGYKFAVGSTAYGDGEYDSTNGKYTFGVDAGNIGIVPLELATKYDFAELRDLGAIFETSGTAKFIAEDGKFAIELPNEFIEIDTAYDYEDNEWNWADDEEDYDEDDYDDEYTGM